MIIILLSFFGFFHMGAREFLYPVGSLDYEFGSKIFWVHQKSSDDLTLLIEDLLTHRYDLGLMSLYQPALFTLLSNKSGFSFVDSGGIKIKKWEQRSPHRLELSMPLTNIGIIHWNDTTTLYTSGLYRDTYIIVEINCEGTVHIIHQIHDIDCLYPQKINNVLYYIGRKHNTHSFIAKTEYSKTDSIDDTIIISFTTHVPLFLHMQSEHEGFYITYPSNIKKVDPYVVFQYHYFKKIEENNWHNELLFTFIIPSYLLFDNEQCLCEGLFLLRPKHIGDSIYFSSVLHNNRLKLFMYNVENKTTTQIVQPTKNEDTDVFLPLFVKDVLYTGRSL